MPPIDYHNPLYVGMNEGSVATVFNNGNVPIFFQSTNPGGTISPLIYDGVIQTNQTNKFKNSFWLLASAPAAQAEVNVQNEIFFGGGGANGATGATGPAGPQGPIGPGGGATGPT